MRWRRRRCCPALVLLSTAATVIASQATISGAFSVTREAVQLDLLPRVRVLQTSAEALGQIYVPAANLFMFDRGGAVRGRLRQLERAVGGLRRVGGGHHADHHLVRRAGREVAVELAVVARRRVVRAHAAGRPGLRGRQRSPRSTTAAGCRWRSPA